jgi:CRP-like cAMP-binding protein
MGMQRSDHESKSTTRSDHRELNPLRAALHQVPLFSDLSDAEIDDLATATTLIKCPKNSYVFRHGDPGDSLFVIVTGVVEIVIEHDSACPLTLSSLRSGEFFGEMSLFDARERSADARAVVDVQLLRIDRERFLSRLTPQLATEILAELSQRVRRTDKVLSNLTETASRSAHRSPATAVALELETIRQFYTRTQQVAAETLERAERRSAELLQRCEVSQKQAEQAMAQAQSTLDGIERQVEKKWRTLKLRVAPVLMLVLGILSYFGFSTLGFAKEKLAEIQKMDKDAQTQSAEVNEAASSSRSTAANLASMYQRVRAIEESMGELRSVRDAVAFDRTIDGVEPLKRAALNYERGKETIRRRYLIAQEDGPMFEHYAPEVVFEAVDTYVTLVLAGGVDERLRLDPTEQSELLDALAYVLANLPDVQSTSQPGSSSLMDRKMRDMVLFVVQGAAHDQRTRLIHNLTAALKREPGARARRNLALSLADLDVDSAAVVDVLAELVRSGQPPWFAAAAAIGLAKLGDSRGLEFIDHLLDESDPAAAYPVALTLAEAGRPTLARVIAKARGRTVDDLISKLSRVLSTREPKNCLEERYTNYLLGCLNGAICGNPPQDTREASCKRYLSSHS